MRHSSKSVSLDFLHPWSFWVLGLPGQFAYSSPEHPSHPITYCSFVKLQSKFVIFKILKTYTKMVTKKNDSKDVLKFLVWIKEQFQRKIRKYRIETLLK